MSILKTIGGIFGGPVGVVGGWFASTWGKVLGLGAIVALVASIGGAIYWSWSSAIKDATAAKYIQAQQADTIANNENEIRILKNMAEVQADAIVKHSKSKAEVDLNSDAVSAWIKGRPPEKDRDASEIIKETFERLYGKD